ncbi:hypothetical protein HDU87_001257 [Geranomyces variabilis]|uniref:Uncharacterized protein n=1 Tax=Geranomyces variabilis TaxID=109894 RepID=A0AAD5TBS5_9FUNG|nr:hypothetical protein HDU87_001257 [Geranomyces variabilis]
MPRQEQQPQQQQAQMSSLPRTSGGGSEEVLIPMALSEDNLRAHTKAHSTTPKSDFDAVIRSWASDVGLASSSSLTPASPSSSSSATPISPTTAASGSNPNPAIPTGSGGDSGLTHGMRAMGLSSSRTVGGGSGGGVVVPAGSLPNLAPRRVAGSGATGGGRDASGGSREVGPGGRTRAGASDFRRASDPSLAAAQGGAGGGGSGGGPTSSTPAGRNSRLVCRLKVETEKGQYQMLPVHENDDPLELARAFCRDYRLPTWVHSLENHIRVAKRTYAA